MARRLDAGIDRQHPLDTADEEPRADQQHQRRLGHHERPAGRVAAAAAAPPFLDRDSCGSVLDAWVADV